MARRTLPRKITCFEPIPPRLARNTVIESTFEVGRRFRCTMCIDCGQLAAATVMTRISASGLKDAIRSGYDVRLIVDLARPAPQHAPLPADRLGLYGAVIATRSPRRCSANSLAARRPQLGGMVSERKSNEDMRRLKPDADLTADLLGALADVQETDGKPVRLVRRVAGGSFEFVHDQMHAYLAARWFSQEGFSVAELDVASVFANTQATDLAS
jgi:hypothetical protein